MRLRQCTLSAGTALTTGWIDTRAARVGWAVKLDGDPRWWMVEVVGSVERERHEIPRTWRVGGLP